MRRLHDLVVKPENKRRHQQKYGKKAAYDALCQDESDVLTNGKTHKCNDDESDDRRRSAGENGTAGFPDRLHHGLMDLHAPVFQRRKGMQQENGVVHRHRQLQNSRRGEGKERYRSEDDVRSHIQNDRHDHYEDKEERFHPRRGRQCQDQPYDND